MTDTAAEVKKVFAALRDRPVGVDEQRWRERRERALPRLRRELRAAHGARLRRARYQALAFGAFAAALAMAALLALSVGPTPAPAPHRVAPPRTLLTLAHSSGQVFLSTPQGERVLSAGERLPDPVSGELRTSETGSARLATSRGLSLTLSPATRVELLGLDRERADGQVRLNQGELTCSVPKLGLGKAFSVVTPDARIVVHGTTFSVRAGAGRLPSCVSVLEGVVSVHHGAGEVTLTSGESFGCEPLAAPVEETQKVEPVSRPRAPREPAPKRASGTLGAEADLLGAALAAERSGEYAKAREKLATLLELYPGSPLVPEARQALARVSGRKPSNPQALSP